MLEQKTKTMKTHKTKQQNINGTTNNKQNKKQQTK